MIYLNESTQTLLENIPRDLLAAYKRIQNHTSSQRHTGSFHGELQRAKSDRRFVQYAYGNADYEEISKEEALDLWKNDKHNVQDLRILYRGDLVEYEVRDNGSVYCIYCNKDYPFTATDGKSYKNIAFAPFKKVIEKADKIYKTNEYDHYIGGSDADARTKKQTIDLIGSLDTTDANYRFNPYDSFLKNPRLGISQFDTGSHKPDTDSYPRWTDHALTTKLNKYLSILENKQIIKTKLKAVDATIKKLNKEKDDYTDEEYSQLMTKLNTKKKDYLAEYEEIQNSYIDARRYVIQNFNAENAKINLKLKAYTRDYQRLIGEIRDADARLDNLSKRLSSTSVSSWNENSSRIRSAKEKIKNIMQELDNLRENGIETINPFSSSESLSNQLKEAIQTLKESQKQLYALNSSKIDTEEQQIKKFKDEIDELEADIHPKRLAKRARQAAMDTKELDSDLNDIITFTED